MKAKELTKAEKKARIKELEREIKATRQEIKRIHKEQEKLQKQRAKQKPELTPEQKQILKLTEEMEILKVAVRTLILKDIETVKALKTYEKMINVIIGKMADAKSQSKTTKSKSYKKSYK